MAAGKRSAKKVAFAATDKEGEETPVSKKSKKPITGKKVESNAAYFLWLKDTRKVKKIEGRRRRWGFPRLE